jgi:GTPase involved in cell partitioning and DNA repair
MSESTVTIPLSEYKELETFRDAVLERKSIVVFNKHGYVTVKPVSENEIFQIFIDKIEVLSRENTELNRQIVNKIHEQFKPGNKKWYQL